MGVSGLSQAGTVSLAALEPVWSVLCELVLVGNVGVGITVSVCVRETNLAFSL